MDSKATNENEKENGETCSSISSDLIRGHINTIILRTLYDGDKYGYEIINEIEEKSKGQYTLKQPTLYSALKRLEGQDFVTSYWGGASNGGRRKYFQITDKGRTIVEQNLAEWEYSRTVIDSLISEKDYDFSNPPPTASVDFSLLKKSTTRVPIKKGIEDEDDIELAVSETALNDGNPQTEKEIGENAQGSISEAAAPNESASDEGAAENISFIEEPTCRNVFSVPNSLTQTTPQNIDEMNGENAQNNLSYAESSSYSDNTSCTPPEQTRHQPSYAQEESRLSDEEKQRIHENYKVLIGDDSDATSYYYSHVAKKQESDPTVLSQPAPQPQPTADSDVYFDSQQAQSVNVQNESVLAQHPTYTENAFDEINSSGADLLYANKPPAERNYKNLLSRLYDNATKNRYAEEESAAPEEKTAFVNSAFNTQPTENPEPYSAENRSPAEQGSTASNIEFYDVAEKAENEGLKITTTNGLKNRTAAKSVGNTFDKGKALFITAVYVFIIALAESIINICLKGILKSNDAYVILPFVIDFVMLGIFLFLYLRGYGKNSRKTQSKSYVSASLIVFINLVLLVCLIVYLITVATDVGLGYMKYAIFPCIYLFNIPLFAILYNYNCNKN